jgi:NDP-4-keto-2,6-dideoxyhexose 3-C-methyltransferase
VLEDAFSLGEIYVSNFPRPDESDGLKAPLDMALCRGCGLLQLRHTVKPELLYRNYWYRSGTNSTMRLALADIAGKAETLLPLQTGDTVLDIGCNDGTLLASYKTSGIYRVGYDPAENLAPLSSKVADKVIIGLFDARAYQSEPALSNRRPKIITSIAMFYDLDDPGKFVEDIGAIMHPEGLWIVQMSYLPLMLRDREIGNICHEHLAYYSLASFERVLAPRGFEIVDVELNDVNGGSFRAYIRNRAATPTAYGDPAYRALAATRIQQLRSDEDRMRLEEPATYQEFSGWVERIRKDVVDFIRERAAAGQKTYVYGASTKGNTVLQYYGLGAEEIVAAAERNPDKWGRVTVGSRIPIVSEEQARKDRPPYFLVLPWHFLREFQEREKAYLLAGGRFIMPAPHFTLI